MPYLKVPGSGGRTKKIFLKDLDHLTRKYPRVEDSGYNQITLFGMGFGDRDRPWGSFPWEVLPATAPSLQSPGSAR